MVVQAHGALALDRLAHDISLAATLPPKLNWPGLIEFCMPPRSGGDGRAEHGRRIMHGHLLFSLECAIFSAPGRGHEVLAAGSLPFESVFRRGESDYQDKGDYTLWITFVKHPQQTYQNPPCGGFFGVKIVVASARPLPTTQVHFGQRPQDDCIAGQGDDQPNPLNERHDVSLFSNASGERSQKPRKPE